MIFVVLHVLKTWCISMASNYCIECVNDNAKISVKLLWAKEVGFPPYSNVEMLDVLIIVFSYCTYH